MLQRHYARAVLEHRSYMRKSGDPTYWCRKFLKRFIMAPEELTAYSDMKERITKQCIRETAERTKSEWARLRLMNILSIEYLEGMEMFENIFDHILRPEQDKADSKKPATTTSKCA